jgi:hypothetical protein
VASVELLTSRASSSRQTRDPILVIRSEQVADIYALAGTSFYPGMVLTILPPFTRRSYDG